MLSQKQLEHVCLAWDQSSKTCRYLRQDDNDPQKWYCLKHRLREKNKIDEKVQEYLEECLSKGIDPDNGVMPLGDNCSGYSVLKHVVQGYDVTP
jgi:hypothetical protein